MKMECVTNCACVTCLQYLSKGQILPLSLANKTYVGDQSPEIKDLHPFEEAMIVLSCGMCMILQLREKNDGTHSQKANLISAPNMQKSMHGHTIIFPQQPQTIANILPPSIKDIVVPICVVFIGDKPPSQKWLLEKATLFVEIRFIHLNDWNLRPIQLISGIRLERF